MFSITIQYFYTLQNGHHNKSSYDPSSYKIVTILSTVFPVCTLYPRDLLFYNRKLLPISPLYLFHKPPTSFPFGNYQFVLCTYKSVSVLLWFLDYTYKWNHMVFVFLFLTYLISHNTLWVHPCCHKWQDFIIFMAVYIYTVYSSIYIYTHTHYMCVYMCMYICYIFCIHLLLDTYFVSVSQLL